MNNTNRPGVAQKIENGNVTCNSYFSTLSLLLGVCTFSFLFKARLAFLAYIYSIIGI